MGGAIITLKGNTLAQLRRKVGNRKREAQVMGLVEERVYEVVYDQINKEWKATLWLHT